MRRHAATGEIVVWGDGSPTREFLYVDDCAEGIVLAAERYDGGRASEHRLRRRRSSIKELAETIAELTGFHGSFVWDANKPDGQPRRRLDTSRARREFDFAARTPLRDGLQTTIQWFRTRS